jgi:hypothetical protein
MIPGTEGTETLDTCLARRNGRCYYCHRVRLSRGTGPLMDSLSIPHTVLSYHDFLSSFYVRDPLSEAL